MNLSAEIDELRNVAQHIAEKLEAFILQGTIAPGTRLIQTKVAEQFGVSRLPVRDAFAVLVKKELAVPLPRRGIVVRPIRLKDLQDLFAVRKLVETAAFRASAPALTAQDLAQARALIKAQSELDPRKDFAALLDTDESFHRLLWSRYDNQEMDQILSRLWKRIKLIRAQARDIPEWQTASVSHHEQILAAIEAGDFDSAAKLIGEGISRSEEELTARVRALEQTAAEA